MSEVCFVVRLYGSAIVCRGQELWNVWAFKGNDRHYHVSVVMNIGELSPHLTRLVNAYLDLTYSYPSYLLLFSCA